MEFAYSPKQQELQREARAFIKEHVTAEVQAEMDEQEVEGPGIFSGPHNGPLVQDLFRKIRERGWLGLSYPVEYGGQGGNRIDQYIIEEEFYRVNVAIGLDGSGAPAILAAGTEEQKRFYIPKLINGEVLLAVGLTEPQAGADLAGLQCRAVRDGDDYIINGQKMYTSLAHIATHIYLMARTHPDSERNKGLSIFLIPMDTPGITVRPLMTIQNEPGAPWGTTYGVARTNETFYDDVRVPAANILGKEHEGWSVSAMALNLDRVGAWRYLSGVRRDEDIVNFLKENNFDGYSPAADPTMRDKIAQLWIEGEVARLMTMRSMSIWESGAPFTYEGSAEKVWATDHGVRTTEAIGHILGPYGQLMSTSLRTVERGVFAHNLLGAFQSGINHGSTQAMRDQVARHGYDMPRKR